MYTERDSFTSDSTQKHYALFPMPLHTPQKTQRHTRPETHQTRAAARNVASRNLRRGSHSQLGGVQTGGERVRSRSDAARERGWRVLDSEVVGVVAVAVVLS
eukprot:1190447-Rhodomonas_salina.1